MRSARAKGSKEDGTNLTTRHLSAKSGHGHASTLDRSFLPASFSRLCFQLCASWDHTGLQIAPQSHQELARHGDDRDAARSALQIADAFAEPAAERAARLIAQPGPGELDYRRARFGIAGLADALVAIDPSCRRFANSR